MAKKSSKSVKSRKFSFNHLFAVALMFGVVGGLVGWAAFAAPANKGGGKSGGNGSIVLNLPPSVDNNGDGQPNYGDSVNFKVSTTATDQPFVNLICYQNGVLVLNGWSGYFQNSLNWPNIDFGLGSGAWQSGAADCTAYLDYYTSHGRVITVTSTSFHVNA